MFVCVVCMYVCCMFVRVLYVCMCVVCLYVCCMYVHVLYVCTCVVCMYVCMYALLASYSGVVGA